MVELPDLPAGSDSPCSRAATAMPELTRRAHEPPVTHGLAGTTGGAAQSAQGFAEILWPKALPSAK